MSEPYPGARPFRLKESSIFFGRPEQARALAELWQANRLTVAVGSTGIGKTSLLQAGVYPLITASGADVLPPGSLSYGSAFPSAALPPHNPYSLALLRSWSPGETAARLAGVTVHEFARRRVRRHGRPILAAIDHVEELPADTGPRWAIGQRFMRELAEAVLAQDSRLHLLLLVRPDAVGIVTDIVGGGAPYQIRPLSAKDALAAVSAPIAGTGRVFAEGAAEMLVADLRISPSVATGTGTHYTTADCIEPALLQVVCARLWRELPDDVNIITARDVRAFADVDTTLASHCGQIIAAVADEHDLSAKRLRSWMLSTFVTDQEARASEYEKRADVAGMPRAVVRALVDLHLLTVTLRDGERSYKLLADRLIEPLRRSAEERPLAAKPAEQLRAAERALTSGELDLAERYVNVALCACSQGELRLRAEGMSLRGNLAYECGDPKRAEEQYAEAASLFEAVRDTGAVASELAAVGQMMLAQERTAEAVQQLRAAVDREPNALVAQTQLALALWKLGEGRAAVAVLTAALGIDGGNVVALCARGEILADLGEARTAMLDLDRVTESADPAVHAARGLALAELGDQAAARQEIEDALTSSTTWNGPVLYYAARASSLMRDEVTARELAKRAVIATDPALSAPHRNRALQLAGRRTADQINTGRCLPLL